VLETQRHLKWRSLDHLEAVTMVLCGLCLAGFSTSVFLDVLTRTLAAPWLWLQEVTSTFFVYGIFIGAAAATRRNDHLYLSAITETMSGAPRLAISFRMPSMTPIASLYAAIPISGVLIALFTVEQLVNGWRHGFESAEPAHEEIHIL